jgi:hypothetical protein
MRRAIVGIAGALLLATLVVAIVPAFAVLPGDVMYYYRTSDDSYALSVDATSHQFFFYSPSIYFSTGYNTCDGVGAAVVHGVVAIVGRCTYQGYPSLDVGKGALSGGGKLTGPIVVILAVAGKPPMVMKFTMWQEFP